MPGSCQYFWRARVLPTRCRPVGPGAVSASETIPGSVEGRLRFAACRHHPRAPFKPIQSSPLDHFWAQRYVSWPASRTGAEIKCVTWFRHAMHGIARPACNSSSPNSPRWASSAFKCGGLANGDWARRRLSSNPRLELGPGATFAFGIASLARVTNAGSGRLCHAHQGLRRSEEDSAKG